MDFSSLREQVSNLSLYDLKAGVRKVQNAVMNLTEMEAKVREATNGEPWGASSSLMQEIANGTFNYSLLNEIMPMIYKRFTDKSAEEWRQIYKALQLLEYLIKNGSERVIDDARSHLTLLKMLRQFHYIDQNGKDQGINVRNRAKELAELLSDVERIRAERKKARATRNKYSGVEGGSSIGSSMSGGNSRYGGFGSGDLTYGGYSGGVYGDGGGFGGSTGGFRDSSSRQDRFEEYDEYDEGAVVAPGRRTEDNASSSSMHKGHSTTKKLPEAPRTKAPEVDLLSVGDDDTTTASGANGQQTGKSSLDNGMGALQSGGVDDDDFDDFQSATPTTQPTASAIQSLSSPPRMPPPTSSIAQLAGPTPSLGSQSVNLNNLAGLSSMSSPTSSTISGFSSPLPSTTHQRQPAYQPSQPNYFTSVPSTVNQPSSNQQIFSSTAQTKLTTTTKPSSSSSGDAFGSLWSTASAGIKKPSTPTNQAQKGPNLASMAKEKASAGIWGTTTQPSPQQPQQGSMFQNNQASKPAAVSGQSSGTAGGGLDDLLG